MHFKLTSFALLLFLAGCFEQRDRSKAFKTQGAEGQSSFGTFDSQSAENSRKTASGSTDPEEDSSIPSSSTMPVDQIPLEISHCMWSTNGTDGYAETSNTHVGPHTLCQSSSNSDDVYIQVRDKVLDAQVCLIPLHHEGTKSIYIGEPRCLMLSDNSKIYRVRLFKNRDGFQGSSVTGVMMMKDKAYSYPPPFNQIVLSPDAYIFCSQFLERYNYDGYCQAFKTVGQYIHKKF